MYLLFISFMYLLYYINYINYVLIIFLYLIISGSILFFFNNLLVRFCRWSNFCLQCRRPRFNPWVVKISWSRKWQPTPIFLPGKSREQRSLVGYSQWGCRVEYDWATSLSFLYSLNTFLLCSLLKNIMLEYKIVC